ncbi:MAG: hypothetical protein WB562_09495 [Candidatus Sulfotelmatobacter sp.]
MTAHATFAPAAIADGEQNHRRLLKWVLVFATAAIVALAIYGQDYYRLSQADRPFSPKHHLLKPSGAVGINLGLLGVLLLCGIFLYPLRKRWRWLQKRGNSEHWLDHHVVLGVAAPFCIAFHSSFKFRGLAGVAFWVMVAVALSGLVGRYLYAQIRQQMAVAELSMHTFREVLARQKIIPQADMRRMLFQLPPASRVSRWSSFTALGYIVLSDLARPLRVARLRVRNMEIEPALRTLGGLLPGKNALLEEVIVIARRQALLSRRLLFLSHTQRVFKLWHVVHRPFSYAFAVLALVHIVVAMLMGFF